MISPLSGRPSDLATDVYLNVGTKAS